MPVQPTFSDEDIFAYWAKHQDQTAADMTRRFNVGNNRMVRLRAQFSQWLSAKQAEAVKKVGTTVWREYFELAKQQQELHHKASFSQDNVFIDVQEQLGVPDDRPIIIQCLADIHMGSLATDYDKLTEITKGIMETPNLFVALIGDLTETTVQFKNALAVHSQSWTIEEQHDVLESWLEEIAPKVIFAGWDNHGVEREEKWGAMSNIKRMLNRRFYYANGMGRLDLNHGGAFYKILLSHRMSGVSIFNRLHGVKRTMRLQFPDVDLGVTGDYHTPDVETYYEGQYKRAVLMTGNLKVNDGYTKRYFTLYSQTDMPCIVLHPREKSFGVYLTLGEALAVAQSYKVHDLYEDTHAETGGAEGDGAVAVEAPDNGPGHDAGLEAAEVRSDSEPHADGAGDQPDRNGKKVRRSRKPVKGRGRQGR